MTKVYGPSNLYDPLEDDPVARCDRCGNGIYEGECMFPLGFEKWCERCVMSIKKML